MSVLNIQTGWGCFGSRTAWPLTLECERPTPPRVCMSLVWKPECTKPFRVHPLWATLCSHSSKSIGVCVRQSSTWRLQRHFSLVWWLEAWETWRESQFYEIPRFSQLKLQRIALLYTCHFWCSGLLSQTGRGVGPEWSPNMGSSIKHRSKQGSKHRSKHGTNSLCEFS